METNNLSDELFFKKIDEIIEKWCFEAGINKKQLFEQGIISSNGYYQAIIHKSLRINVLKNIAEYFGKDFLDFFQCLKTENQVNEQQITYGRAKTESEILFKVVDELRSLQKEVEKIKKMRL